MTDGGKPKGGSGGTGGTGGGVITGGGTDAGPVGPAGGLNDGTVPKPKRNPFWDAVLALAAAIMLDALAKSGAPRDNDEKKGTYVTYAKYNPATGETYIGLHVWLRHT